MKWRVNISPRIKLWSIGLAIAILFSIVLSTISNDETLILRWDSFDLLLGTIRGLKWSILIGVVSMLISSLLGVILGLYAGYFQNKGLRVSKIRITWVLLTVFACCFFGVYINATFMDVDLTRIVITIGAIILLSRSLWLLVKKLVKPKRNTTLPIDRYISQAIEILNSTPRIIIIVVLAAVTQQSTLWGLIWIIGLTSWTGIARIMRAETLKCKENYYIESAKALGLRNKTIMLRHVLPNTITPVLVNISFGIGSIIMIESGLSFLGIGVPVETITLGKIVAFGQTHLDKWEFIAIPGLFICFIVLAFHQLGYHLRKNGVRRIS